MTMTPGVAAWRTRAVFSAAVVVSQVLAALAAIRFEDAGFRLGVNWRLFEEMMTLGIVGVAPAAVWLVARATSQDARRMSWRALLVIYAVCRTAIWVADRSAVPPGSPDEWPGWLDLTTTLTVPFLAALAGASIPAATSASVRTLESAQ
jgi:hypothetical protein